MAPTERQWPAGFSERAVVFVTAWVVGAWPPQRDNGLLGFVKGLWSLSLPGLLEHGFCPHQPQAERDNDLFCCIVLNGALCPRLGLG